MQPIQGFETARAVHGRTAGQLPAGTYVMLITSCKEGVTGYGNACLKIAYDVVDGEYAGIYADILDDPEQNWRHEVEVDVEESGGGRLKALVDAVQASNPGYVWDWNEAGLVGKFVGIVLQERLYTLTKGQRRGQTSRALDFWDAVSAFDVRSGAVSIVPPVNDKRTNKDDARPQAAPVAVPPTVAAPQAPAAPAVPQTSFAAPQPTTSAIGVPNVQSAAAPQMANGYQQPAAPVSAAAPQPQQYQPQTIQYNPSAQAGALYDSDIPF